MGNPSLVQHGGWPFLITSIIGRLPPAMVQLGLLMYVTALGLGLGLGGLTVAAVGLGTAISATLMGRLVDKFGPLPVVSVATLVQVSGLSIIHLLTPGLVSGDTPSAALLVAAGLCGFANPQIGPIVRSHWSHLSRRRNEPVLVSHALGYEGAVDEMSFIVGPIAASFLVAFLGPTPALFTLMGIIIVGQGVFILYLFTDRAAWDHRTVEKQSGSGQIPYLSLVPPLVVLLAVGVTFGATQTGLTAVNESRGTPQLTGLIYGSVGLGSAISSVLTPRLALGVRPAVRLAVGSGLLLIGALGFTTLPDPGASLVFAILLGLGVGIILVTGFARAEAVAPTSRIAQVMTMLSMCLTLGVSIGAATAGQLADTLWHAFLPVIVAGVMAVLASIAVGLSEQH